MQTIYHVGVDAGSTTLKLIVLNTGNEIVYHSYTRHQANVSKTLVEQLRALDEALPGAAFRFCITGSAGMGIAERFGLSFIQEVVSSVELVRKQFPEVRTLLDLGGEDAKMVFLTPGKHPDIRMNGNCAGGTGAFIDQMASLMNIPIERMDEEARKSQTIYPIASRCGVFAKTDIQNLISRNVPVADIAASTLHAVALQNITSLARGCQVEAPVMCVGGPLTFIPSLQDAFAQVLKMDPSGFFLPERAQYFPAWGAALHVEASDEALAMTDVMMRLQTEQAEQTAALPRLFADEADYQIWKQNRSVKKLAVRAPRQGEQVNAFLGIDSGSTTTKIVVVDEEDRILFKFYANNEGNALKKTLEGLHLFFDEMAEAEAQVNIVGSAATGYGEELIKSALNLDHGIVETMAHLFGAQFVDPQVSFILDIGGQDMKSIFIDQGVIANIELNEACSSGCGSFLQNFASTMNIPIAEFSSRACLATNPSDLGSRCTVFMNSKVKQSLRENATPDDIAAGLAYSVVKNCLFKVLKVDNLNRLGDHIVVQGGTFRNDAVYRALEQLSGKQVSSTDHPELMGAFGAALYARVHPTAGNAYVLNPSRLDALASEVQTSEINCKGCTNTCTVLRFRFPNGNSCYAGNKCEKIFHGKGKEHMSGYNAFEQKNELIWRRKKDRPQGEGRMRIGIPRILNLFENFPFWNTLFSECGFEVVLSPESTTQLYRNGIATVMSDNICFPAKLAHGHIHALLEQKVDRIFYPIVPKDEKELNNTNNSYNCPIVSGYPDVIRSAMDPEQRYGIAFDSPVISFNDNQALEITCRRYFQGLGVDKKQFKTAFAAALDYRKVYKDELIEQQQAILQDAIAKGRPVFVVAGRPYHSDPLIHQKTGQLLADLGATVLTDDVFRYTSEAGYGRLGIVAQWSYPNRVIQAALQVAKLPNNVQMIQLNSFGCGPDSFFMDEATAILKAAGKNLTIIRIDEIASPGSVRLRLRSVIESLRSNSRKATKDELRIAYKAHSVPYTKEDKQKTILLPWLCDFINPFAPALGELAGYKLVNLPKSDRESVELGLQYGHNEVCYPSTLVLGDLLKGLRSGNYDLDDVVVAITQTGGQCRATNYIAQIKTALDRAGYGHIPVLSLTSGKTFQNEQSGFKIPWRKLIKIAAAAVLLGDNLQQMYNAVAPREKKKGETRQLFDFYMERAVERVSQNDSKGVMMLLEQAVADFNTIAIHERAFTKVGLIGEIFVKYNNYGQAYISEWLRENGMEVVTPPIMDFLLQYFVNYKVNTENGIKPGSRLMEMLLPFAQKWVTKRMKESDAIMQQFRFYHPNESVFLKAEYAGEAISLTSQFGEGWAIAGEVASFARSGIDKVVCIQPFGCIANQVVAKGIENRLKRLYPNISILYLDLDGGMGEVNLQNRLHFLIR